MDRSTETAAQRRALTRTEAARYLTERWFPNSPKTLAKLAVIGGGPAFRRAGRVPLYTPTDLDAWAESKMSPKVTSTSQLRAA